MTGKTSAEALVADRHQEIAVEGGAGKVIQRVDWRRWVTVGLHRSPGCLINSNAQPWSTRISVAELTNQVDFKINRLRGGRFR